MLRTCCLLTAGMLISATVVGAQVDPPTRLIIGMVIDSVSGLGIADVSVIAKGTRNGSLTKANGSYSILGVPGSDSLTIEAKRNGYETRFIRIPGGVDTVVVSFILPRSKERPRNFFPIPVDTSRPPPPIPRRAR